MIFCAVALETEIPTGKNEHQSVGLLYKLRKAQAKLRGKVHFKVKVMPVQILSLIVQVPASIVRARHLKERIRHQMLAT